MVMVVSSTPLPLQYHPHRLLLDTNNHGNNRTGGGGGGVGNTYTDDGNFDSNMVIILAALLCALICALGLNSIVRFAIRCSHRLVAFDTPHQASVLRLAAATGLHKQALNDIPVVVYGSSSSQFNTSIIIPATDCPICLSEFADGDKVRILPNCNHGFHVNCIDTWFTSRSSCPICRRPLGCDEVTSSSSSTTVPVLEEEEAAVDVSVRSPANGTSEEPHGFVIITVNHDEVS